MREIPEAEKWVVYETVTGPKAGTRSVCTASEWSGVESSQPGINKIIKEGITDETEAEKLARGTSGDLKARQKATRPKFE